MRVPTSYFGGKSRLAPWIASLLPTHRTYVEPYFGSGAVLFAKPPSHTEIVNDLDGEIVNFFRVLRDRYEDLERACVLTPYARSTTPARSTRPLMRSSGLAAGSSASTRASPTRRATPAGRSPAPATLVAGPTTRTSSPATSPGSPPRRRASSASRSTTGPRLR